MKLEEAGAQAIAELTKWIKGGVELGVQQAPEVARQYLVWYQAEATLGLIFGVILLGCATIAWAGKKPDEEWGDNEGKLITLIAGLVGGTIATIVNLMNLVQVIVAPKIVLLEKLTQLMRHGG